MKISYISGVDNQQSVMSKDSNLIGSLDWADRAGVKLSLSQKAEIKKKQFNPLISTARGIVRELISGNRGGLADMLYAMSPFNTAGKIDPSLKNQFDAGNKEIIAIAKQKYPVTEKTLTVAEYLTLKKKYPLKSNEDLKIIESPNYNKYKAFIKEERKKLNKKFPFVIYPPSNLDSHKKYRELEIMWLNYGGNVDTFNAAVKEGVTKSPRNKTFNYLLGKFAAKTYKTKDLGLAIRAVVGAALGGDRFSWTDKKIFNPWLKRFGSGNIGTAIGVEPVSTAATTVATTAASAWWVPILTKLCYTIIAMLPLLFNDWLNNDENPTPQVGTGGNGGNGGGNNNETFLGGNILPIAAAIGAYILLFNDDNK